MSQAVVIGDKKKHLSCLLTLKVEIDPETNLPTDKLDTVVKDWCKSILTENKIEEKDQKIPVNTIDFIEGPHSDMFMKGIQDRIDAVNSNAAFRAAEVRKFCVLEHELLEETLVLQFYLRYESFIRKGSNFVCENIKQH